MERRLLSENVLLASELVTDFHVEGRISQLTPRRGDDWIWKRLCKLIRVSRPFVVCEVGSGITTIFWFDNWTDLGPLIHLTGERGLMVSGLNAIITLLGQCLPLPTPIIQSSDDDTYLWKTGEAPPSTTFSTAKTWLTLHQPNLPVYWHDQVWFKGRYQSMLLFLGLW
uniref:Reverse transcriptase zinc-binding domain-containing protein n=1 Tax=Brassica oleracea TaxID=3712 RepID=A0A3P6FVB0_BRAOL|nr:unnamed protein product [Brassica oleracea]